MATIDGIIQQNLLDAFNKTYDAIAANPSLGQTRDAIELRRSRSEDFDGLSAEDYSQSLAAGKNTSTFVMDPIQRPLAHLFGGLDLGNVLGQLDFFQIRVAQSDVREWAGASFFGDMEGTVFVEDPVFALRSKLMNNIPALPTGVTNTAASLFPRSYVFLPRM